MTHCGYSGGNTALKKRWADPVEKGSAKMKVLLAGALVLMGVQSRRFGEPSMIVGLPGKEVTTSNWSCPSGVRLGERKPSFTTWIVFASRRQGMQRSPLKPRYC